MITSTSNPNVRRVIAYREKAKARREDGVFVVEGIKEVAEIPEGWIREMYVAEGALSVRFGGTSPIGRGVVVSEAVFGKMSGVKTPQGVLAVVRQPEYSFEDVTTGECPLILLLEDIQDPGNAGTILRTAEAAGASGVILTKGCVDIFSPKVVRATMGAIFRVPFVYTDDAKECVRKLREKGMNVYAAAADAKETLYDEDLRGASVFLIGNEGRGLSGELLDAATKSLSIPMEGKTESLNAAVSASLLMYEAARQRRGHG